jgi:hypothetical protein
MVTSLPWETSPSSGRVVRSWLAPGPDRKSGSQKESVSWFLEQGRPEMEALFAAISDEFDILTGFIAPGTKFAALVRSLQRS